MTPRDHVLSFLLAAWQVATGTLTLVGGPQRSSARRFADIADLLDLLGAPVHFWGLLPLAGGALLLAGQLLMVTRVLPAVGGCRALMFAGHLAGVATAWVLGVSAALIAAAEPGATFAAPSVYLGLALPVSAYYAAVTALAVRRSARNGNPRCAA